MKYIKIDTESGEHKAYTNEKISHFLVQNLDEFGDAQADILKAINYALDPKRGGFVIVAIENDVIVGAVVINKTGMDGYIPSNILVYIAVHSSQRGKGVGKGIIQEVIKYTKGGIALHVEPHNPAKRLYERLGFTNKYLEMRYQHDEN